MPRNFESAKDSYIRNLFAKEDSLLQTIRIDLEKNVKEGMNIGSTEAQILQFLIRLKNIKTIVEIGSLYGYSSIWMARALPSDGKIDTIETCKNHFIKAKNYIQISDVSKKVQVHYGKASKILPFLTSKTPFDMIFIDADKQAYPEYLDWAEQNIKKNGLIVADNTFLFGHVYGEGRTDLRVTESQIQAMKTFNKRLSDTKKYNTALLPTGEGLSVAIKF